jgi:hypothetical protein
MPKRQPVRANSRTAADDPVDSDLPAVPRRRRPKRLRAKPRELTVAQILAWADAHHVRTGRWPIAKSGPVADALGENWNAIEAALRGGHRGLPGGSSLARLLAAQRGRHNHLDVLPLSQEQILIWADTFFAEQGCWPTKTSGPIAEAPEQTWCAIDLALKRGSRGLAGGSSLAQLLAQQRGRRNVQDLPAVSEEQILAWADQHLRRTGRWPEKKDGPVDGVPGEVWRNIDAALAHGTRGLAGGSSLARLLAARRGRRNPKGLPPLTVEQILAWADQFYEREGRYPTDRDGEVPGTGGELWNNIDGALYKGKRGLPGGTSLPQLLAEQRGVRNRKALAGLTVPQIIEWAKAYQQRHGRWPNENSGPVEAAAGEVWYNVDAALRTGFRGLPGGSSLYRILLEAGLRERVAGH